MTRTLRVLGFHNITKRVFSMNKITMEELKSGMCRWPFGNTEDEGLSFCGKPSDPAAPYCEEHTIMAQAPSRRPKAT
ncbi:MAG: hypothetical protein COB36_03055 [Alphaproteobacteria bacterium]|nr:MAG: hypothetical protein COB36_03055 [Alphaproteobacteria bacterium]